MGQLVRYLIGRRNRYGADSAIPSNITDTEFSGNAALNQRVFFTNGINQNYEFKFIPWVEYGIGYSLIPSGYDFLSTRFGGCYMAVYTDFNDRGYYQCGAHIHMGDSNQKDNWNNYVREHELIGVLFRPFYTLDMKMNLVREKFPLLRGDDLVLYIRKDISIWGIISSERECFSMIVYRKRPTHNDISNDPNPWLFSPIGFGKSNPIRDLNGNNTLIIP